MKRLLDMARRLCVGLKNPVALVNAFGAGTHANGIVTKKCDAVLSVADLLVKIGSDADHVAVTAASTEAPFGFSDAPTDAIEDEVAVRLPGKGGDTKLGWSGAAIAVGDRLVPAANGRVTPLPTGSGTYWVVGKALSAASGAGEPVEIDDCHPYPVVVSG